MIKRDGWEHKLLLKLADLMGYSATYFEQEKTDEVVIISKIRFSHPNPNLYWRNRLARRRFINVAEHQEKEIYVEEEKKK